MNKRLDPVLAATLGITVSLMSVSVWLLSQSNLSFLGSSQTPSVSNKTLRILGDSFSGYSMLRSPAFQKLLKNQGVEIRYEDELDQVKRAKRLSEGSADLIVTTLDQYLMQQANGTLGNGKVVGLIDQTLGADAVVLNTKQYPRLKSLLDLSQLAQQSKAQGKPLGIAFAGNTPSDYLALVLDAKFDEFNLSDFRVTRVADAAVAWKLMQDPQQNIALTVLWEPFVSQARLAGNSVVLSSKDVPGTIVDVWVASDRLIQSQPKSITGLLDAYYRQIDANAQDSAPLLAQIAQEGKLSDVEASGALDGIEFFTAIESQSWMKDGTLERRIKSTAAVLALAGRVKEVPAPQGLFTREFLAEAATNTQDLIALVRVDNPTLAARLSGKARSVVAAPALQSSEIQNAPDVGNLKVRGEVEFASGSTQLSGQSAQTLAKLAQEINEFNPRTIAIRVIGHTSQTGTADVNQALSLQRAQVVVDYLRDRGVRHNIVAEGKGFGQPLPDLAPTDIKNQRTEIRLVRIRSSAAQAGAN